MDHNVNIECKTMEKHTGENLWDVGPDRVVSLDTKNTVHERENW